jgi:hypothetical protein
MMVMRERTRLLRCAHISRPVTLILPCSWQTWYVTSYTPSSRSHQRLHLYTVAEAHTHNVQEVRYSITTTRNTGKVNWMQIPTISVTWCYRKAWRSKYWSTSSEEKSFSWSTHWSKQHFLRGVPGTLKTDVVTFLFEYRVVGIGARYWLDGAGIEPLWGRHFPHSSRPALEPTQPPIQRTPGHFWRVKTPRRGVNHPPPSSAEVKERVALYLYSPSGPL